MEPQPRRTKANRRQKQPPRSKDYVGIAQQYAQDVVAGRVVACKLLIKRCASFLDELGRDWEFTFDVAKASKPCQFMECLPVPDGKSEQLVVLQPWQCFVVANIFGWVHRATGMRRFTQAHVWIAAGNGKSFLASAVGLYMAFHDGQRAAEVACAAFSRKQAEIVFDTASQMMQFRPDFAQFLGVEINAHTLVQEKTGSKLEARSAEAKTLAGMRPYCVVVDELHVVTQEVYAFLTNRLAKRDQTLLLTISTAGYDTTSIGHTIFEQSVQVIDGSAVAPEVFAIVYQADDISDPTDERQWAMAHPNLDVTVRRNILRSKAREAATYSRLRNQFTTEQLDRWVSAGEAWIDMDRWDEAADELLRIEDFKGKPCWIGIDLANVSDVCSVAVVFPEDRADGQHLTVFWRNYLPEAVTGKHASYSGWVEDRCLIATPGNSTDYAFVREEVLRLVREHDVRCVCIDQWNATHIAQELQAELGEDRVVLVSMGVANMNAPAKTLEGAVLEGRLHHTGDPCVRWMIGNAQVQTSALENIRLWKQDKAAKIDAAVALVVALNQVPNVVDAGPLVFHVLGSSS